MYAVRRLNKDQIIEAQCLLHDDYRYNQKWYLLPDNPSNLRYLDGRLRDDFEDTAVWFGTFYKGKIVATIRFINGDLEVSRYLDLPLPVGTFEVNRLCVRKDFRGSLALPLVSFYSFVWGLINGYKTACTTFSPKLAKHFVKLGWQDSGVRFRYHPSDKEERVLLLLPGSVYGLIKYAIRSVLG
jgi:hypothetical protein